MVKRYDSCFPFCNIKVPEDAFYRQQRRPLQTQLQKDTCFLQVSIKVSLSSILALFAQLPMEPQLQACAEVFDTSFSDPALIYVYSAKGINQPSTATACLVCTLSATTVRLEVEANSDELISNPLSVAWLQSSRGGH